MSIKKEQIRKIRENRFKMDVASNCIHRGHYEASRVRKHTKKAEKIYRISKKKYWAELKKLGHKANAEDHIKTWLDKIKDCPPEQQAQTIHALLNVARDFIRESNSCYRVGNNDPIFLGQCIIYAQKYQKELNRICREHNLVHIIGGFYRKKL